jgi:hypothetical protein
MESWVGFSPSPKPAAGTSKHQEQIAIQGRFSPKACLDLIATGAGLESWLGQVEKFDFRLGAKLSYMTKDEKYGATYSKIQIPKSVILVTETLGEIQFSIVEKKGEVTLKAGFTKQLSEAEVESWRSEVSSVGSRMRGVLIE